MNVVTKNAFYLMFIFVAAAKCSTESVLQRTPMMNITSYKIYEAVTKLHEGDRNDTLWSDTVGCPVIRKVKNLPENFIRKSPLPLFLDQLENAKCKDQILSFMNDFQNSSSWAVEMFDASSKFPSGLITANTFQLGNYDQCINVESQIHAIKGKYCLAEVYFSPLFHKYPPFHRLHMENEFSLDYNPYKSVLEKFKVTRDFTKKRRNVFHSAICIPHSCTAKDTEILLKYLILPSAKEFGYYVEVKIAENSCSVKDFKELSKEGKILGLIISGTVLFVILCTVWDFLKGLKGSTRGKQYQVCIYEMFSLRRNTSKFLNHEVKDSMNVFNGMKSLSMILIIMGHRCMASCGGPFLNPQFLEERYRKIQNILLLNGTIIVDTFFLIGGYLTFLTLFKEYKKNKKSNPFKVYLYRWLRIFPVYMLMIFFYAYLLEYIGTGPFWSKKIGREAERCRKNWWTNFLFINNYINTDSLCMFQSWYVTCDMHFILLAPFIVKSIVKSPKKGYLLLLLLIVGSLLTIFMVTYYNKYDGVLRVYISTFEDLTTSFTFNRVYIKTHNRATPYFSGMAAAYIYIKLKQTHHKFSLCQVYILSILAVVFALIAICGAWLFYIPGREYNALENALYASFHRLLWAVSMSWIALAGGTNAFGIIEPILSQKFFIPFSKLSYTAFLVHGVVQMYTSATLRTPEHMSFPKLYWMTCGDVIISFFFAFLLHVFFEAPVKEIQKFLFSRKTNEKSE